MAEYQGTPGKIAYVDSSSAEYPLKVWDPALATAAQPENGISILVKSTFHRAAAGSHEAISGQASTPVFSPDGTQIAYSALVKDPGIPAPGVGYHSAIYVMNADGSGQHQVTFPEEAVVPPEECKEQCPGHTVADYMPSWSPDGKTLSFIRAVSATEYDTLYYEHGQNVWTVPVAGGGGEQLTNGENSVFYTADVWGKQGIVASFSDSNGQELGLIPPGANAPTVIASPRAITDWDVSPDGEHVTYLTPGGGGIEEHVVDAGGGNDEVLTTGVTAPLVRWSNTGNGPLRPDCETVEGGGKRCGIFEEHTPDPEGDIRSDEGPDRFMLPYISFGGVYAGLGRSLWDVQAQQLPVIFIPGFLGSEIKGCGSTEWFTVPPDLLGMRLGPDGTTNEGCADSAPDGELVTFYKETAKWIELVFGSKHTLFECERANTLGWDWRKAPQASIERLEQKITEALEADTCAHKEGAKRVVIMAHSYGGLLTRTFVDDSERARRVARVLTVGTPYWGAPKSLFPAAFGIESPFNKDNLIFNEEDLKTFADNLAGLMQLYPSASYGPWLTFNGDTYPAGIGAQPFIASIGASSSLFGQAQSNHENIDDQLTSQKQTIDYRQVVGTGEPTPGGIQIEGAIGGDAKIHISWTNGDGTVPARSAGTGEIGTQPTDKGVHLQDICGVGHMDETDAEQVHSAYVDFLDFGRIPRKTEGSCDGSAGILTISKSSGKLGGNTGSHKLHRAAGAQPAVEPPEPMSLEEAYLANLIDLYDLPSEEIAVFDPSKPVRIAGHAEDLTFTLESVDTKGGTVSHSYGPVTGELELSEASGKAPSVLLDGHSLDEAPAEEAKGGEPTQPPIGGSSAQERREAAERALREAAERAVAAMTGPPPAPGMTASVPQIAIAAPRSVRLRGGSIALTVTCQHACTVAGTLGPAKTTAKGHPPAFRPVRLPGSGKPTRVLLRFTRAQRTLATRLLRRHIRVAARIAVTAAGGARKSVSVAVL